MPSGNNDDDDEEYLFTETRDIKLVSDYTKLNFNQALELDCYTYKAIVRDAFIDKMSKTEEGREYLQDCWILT